LNGDNCGTGVVQSEGIVQGARHVTIANVIVRTERDEVDAADNPNQPKLGPRLDSQIIHSAIAGLN
jgi:hypothetical protein